MIIIFELGGTFEHVHAWSLSLNCYHPGPHPLLALADLPATRSSSVPALLLAASRADSLHKARNPHCADVGFSTYHPEPGQIPPKCVSLWFVVVLTISP